MSVTACAGRTVAITAYSSGRLSPVISVDEGIPPVRSRKACEQGPLLRVTGSQRGGSRMTLRSERLTPKDWTGLGAFSQEGTYSRRVPPATTEGSPKL